MPGHADRRVLCDRTLRTMSGGEPSSIKRLPRCAADHLFIRVTEHTTGIFYENATVCVFMK